MSRRGEAVASVEGGGKAVEGPGKADESPGKVVAVLGAALGTAANETRRGPWLVLDTATQVALLALGDAAGVRVEQAWPAGFRHGEELLVRLEALLGAAGLRATDLGAVIVGTGPGAFTGLRVGLATAKGLAYGLGLPIVGVSSGAALVDAARAAGLRDPAILLPAGPNDRVLVEGGDDGEVHARRLPAGVDPELPTGRRLVALDLEGRATPEELAPGPAVRARLAAAMLHLAAARVAAGGDDLSELVPEYVTAPRGVMREGGPVTIGHA